MSFYSIYEIIVTNSYARRNEHGHEGEDEHRHEDEDEHSHRHEHGDGDGSLIDASVKAVVGGGDREEGGRDREEGGLLDLGGLTRGLDPGKIIGLVGNLPETVTSTIGGIPVLGPLISGLLLTLLSLLGSVGDLDLH